MLINSDSLLKKFESGALLFQPDVRKVIESEPEAVVRCKDCAFNDEYAWYECPMLETAKQKDNDFCSRGERRTDVDE